MTAVGDTLTIKLKASHPIKTIFVPFYNQLQADMNPEVPSQYDAKMDRESASYKVNQA